MSSSNSSPSSTFFNDPTQPIPSRQPTNESNGDDTQRDLGYEPGNENQPRAKRIACVLCRKRKLRCDGNRPKCGTCSRLSHECGYDEVRKKSGPKRGYVKLLEQRLQQVETLLKTNTQQDGVPPLDNTQIPQAHNDNLAGTGDRMETQAHENGMVFTSLHDLPQLNKTNAHTTNTTDSFSWEMIGLGLEEPLPTQETINELHDIYFDKLHSSVPMIHRPRYLAAMNLAPNMRPPVCLRYIVWTMAASVSDKYFSAASEFYRRARKYAEADEMKGNGEAMITLAHCQAWVLITWYEFKNMYFPRAWQSTGRAASLATMMGLNRLDGAVLDVKQCLPPPKDWTEREERRRTFWMAFCADRYASIGTGWAHRLDERDIMTLLPTDDEAFVKSRPQTAPSLEQAFSNAAAFNVSAVSGVVLIACLLGRNLTHLHRPTPNDNEEDLNGGFWQRHRQLESILDNIALAMPDHLRIPNGLPDSNVIFMNMLLHTSVICLHQAAIFKADRNRLSQQIINESRARCLAGAAEITRIMKMMSHVDLSTLNPFLSFCLYVAARVFVQYLKWRPKDQNMTGSLQFLGSAMHALSRKNPLTESFMAQLEVDLEGTGIFIGGRSAIWNQKGNGCEATRGKGQQGILVDINEDPQARRGPTEIPLNPDSVKCSPLFELRESQGANQNNDIFQRQPQPYSYNSSINIEIDPTFTNADPSMPYQLPSRSKDNPFDQRMSLLDQLNINQSEMDFSTTSKSRSESHIDSSSASFTPPSLGESSEPPYPTPMDKGRSPGVRSLNESGTTPNSMPTPGGSSSNNADVMFFEVPDGPFQNYNANPFAPFAPGDMGFNNSTGTGGIGSGHTNPHGGGWDIGSMGDGGSATTGLTPMTNEGWNEILSSANDYMNTHGGNNAR